MVLWVGEIQNLRIRIRFFHAKKQITIIKRWRLRSSYLFSHQCKSVSKTRKKAFFNIVNWIYASTANSYFCLQTAQYWIRSGKKQPVHCPCAVHFAWNNSQFDWRSYCGRTLPYARGGDGLCHHPRFTTAISISHCFLVTTQHRRRSATKEIKL